MENNSIESQYRETIGNDDYITITIDEYMNNISGIHDYSLYVNANNTNTTQVVGGTLYLEYIPNENAYLNIY